MRALPELMKNWPCGVLPRSFVAKAPLDDNKGEKEKTLCTQWWKKICGEKTRKIKKSRKTLADSKKSRTFASLLKRSTSEKKFWRDGRVVDRGGLENRCTERYRGFESLPFRRRASWKTCSFFYFHICCALCGCIPPNLNLFKKTYKQYSLFFAFFFCWKNKK